MLLNFSNLDKVDIEKDYFVIFLQNINIEYNFAGSGKKAKELIYKTENEFQAILEKKKFDMMQKRINYKLKFIGVNYSEPTIIHQIKGYQLDLFLFFYASKLDTLLFNDETNKGFFIITDTAKDCKSIFKDYCKTIKKEPYNNFQIKTTQPLPFKTELNRIDKNLDTKDKEHAEFLNKPFIDYQNKVPDNKEDTKILNQNEIENEKNNFMKSFMDKIKTDRI